MPGEAKVKVDSKWRHKLTARTATVTGVHVKGFIFIRYEDGLESASRSEGIFREDHEPLDEDTNGS